MSRREPYLIYQSRFQTAEFVAPVIPDKSIEWIGAFPDLIPGRVIARQNLGGYYGTPTDEEFIPPTTGLKRRRVIGGGFDL